MERSTEPSDDLPETARSLPIALVRVRERVMAPIREMLAASGITEQQWRILRVLEEGGEREASQLAREACLLLPSQTRIVRSMVDKGLVTRTTIATDKRRQRVAITAKGRAVVDSNREQAARIAARFRHTLGHVRFEDLLDMLEDLERKL